MKVSDYIVEYLIAKDIRHVFGYPGGMVTHLMESFSKYNDKIAAHVSYHEQGAAFAACGYAQATGKVGVAYATSGPGATNLITGICNAYFDSIPTLFITGQVNTNERKGDLRLRQRGFQETDIVPMVAGVTKYAAQLERPEDIKYCMDRAFFEALSGRKGPVLLDIPMNIFRAEIDENLLMGFAPSLYCQYAGKADIYESLEVTLENSKAPVLLLGNGIKTAGEAERIQKLVDTLGIPTVTSMIAVDVLTDSTYNYGFIGAYGDRAANFIVAKADLLITIGSRLDIRQVGAKRENFAPKANIIRFDIDEGELEYEVHEDEIQIETDLSLVIDALTELARRHDYKNKFVPWLLKANIIKEKLYGIDDKKPNKIVRELSRYIPENALITTDVGQNQVWAAQSFDFKKGQQMFFSGGHGAMGYALPAAIGASVENKAITYAFTGDGGLQMNIQELMFVAREQLPVKLVLFNNNALGMIRHFQEMYFQDNFFQTVPAGGFESPDFSKIAQAYGIRYARVNNIDEIADVDENIWIDQRPAFIEVIIDEPTYVFPKLKFGNPNYDQEPLLDRALLKELIEL